MPRSRHAAARLMGLLTAALLLAVPTGATPQTSPSGGKHAEPADPDAGDDIVVVGRDLTDQIRVRSLATRITRDASPGLPMARFSQPACFSVIGLPSPVSGLFVQRLTANATRAGVAVLKPGCRPNIVIGFTDDGRSDLQLLRRKLPWIFGNLAPFEIDRSIDEPGPVHAWANVETRTSDGGRYVTVASIIDLPVRRDIVSTVILIDRPAAIGKTLYQLADYATLRGLAVLRTAGLRPDEDTILTLFEGAAGSHPRGLTAFDRGYLAELYAGDGNVRTSIKLTQIARRIARDPPIR